MSSLPRPSLDPDLNQAHASFPRRAGLYPMEKLQEVRAFANVSNSWDHINTGREDTIHHYETYIPGPAQSLSASIFRAKKNMASAGPGSSRNTVGILHLHGGGHIMCNRFTGINALFNIIESVDCVVISLEYRLAPEHPAPAQLGDCYAALAWLVAHASDPGLAFNPEKLVVCGGSAGGTLAVGVALFARARAPAHANPAVNISGVLLFYPWLDDSSDSLSYDQYGTMPPWTKQDNTDAWDYVLGRDRAAADIYTVPARAQAEDLVGFPSTYIDVGEADVLRDSNVKFATTLWAAGTTAELHVWPGAWHAFEVFVPGAEVSRRAGRARLEWLQRLVR